MAFDLQQQSREADKLPIESLAHYLEKSMPEFMANNKLHISQFSSGASNLTYRLSNGIKSVILRRPPVGTKAKSAHDMAREYDVLKKLEPHFSLSPKSILLCKDETIIESEFFIMQEIAGLGIDKNLPVVMAEEQHLSLCKNFVNTLVELHRIDIVNTELKTLGKPEGYVERQLEGWQKRYVKAKTDDVPDSDVIYRWLKKNLTLDSGLGSLVHNDFKFDNLILDTEQPDKIIGVLDWEMTTLGDPLLDLGCSLAYWIEAEDPVEMQAVRMMPTHLPGMMTRLQVFDYYCQLRGLGEISFTPYYVFGLFRLAVIGQQIYFRFYHGQTDNPKFSNLGQLVNILMQAANLQIVHYEN